MLKYKFYWIFVLVLFLYTSKRYDIDFEWEMRYNSQITADEIFKG